VPGVPKPDRQLLPQRNHAVPLRQRSKTWCYEALAGVGRRLLKPATPAPASAFNVGTCDDFLNQLLLPNARNWKMLYHTHAPVWECEHADVGLNATATTTCLPFAQPVSLTMQHRGTPGRADTASCHRRCAIRAALHVEELAKTNRTELLPSNERTISSQLCSKRCREEKDPVLSKIHLLNGKSREPHESVCGVLHAPQMAGTLVVSQQLV